jgi:hypothetical protein
MAKLITQAKFARKIKLTPGRISQLVKEGIILLVHGRVDPVQAEKAIRDKVDRSRQLDLELKSKSQKISSVPPTEIKTETQRKRQTKNQGDSDELSLTEVRRNHELLKAELTALQLQIKRGELVPKGEQIKWLIALGSAAKLAFQGLPKRLAPIIRLYDDEKKIEVIIRDEIYKIIREMEKPLDATKSRNPKKRNSR